MGSMKEIPCSNSTFAVAVEDHLGLLKSCVLKFVRKGRVEDSELYSVGCVALVEAARTFDPSKAKFCTWATRIIRQRIIDEIKRTRRIQEDPTSEMSSLASDDEDGPPVHLLDDIMKNSKGCIGKDDAKMLLGHYLDGRSLSDLGREFGLSKEWVRKKMQTAVSKIRVKNRELMENYL